MPKAKSATATKKANPVKEEKPKERFLPVLRLPSQWRVGDQIVVETNRMGYVTKTTTIKKIETGQGCKNLHVNDTACYDRGKEWAIAVPEIEALELGLA
jgi:hypothetical protein